MKDNRGNGLAEDQGRFLGFLNGFSHVGRESWLIRAPRRAMVAEIILWGAILIGTIGGPSWAGVGLHALHARPVRTALECC